MAKEIILREFDCLRCKKPFMSARLRPNRCGKCKSRAWDRPPGVISTTDKRFKTPPQVLVRPRKLAHEARA